MRLFFRYGVDQLQGEIPLSKERNPVNREGKKWLLAVFLKLLLMKLVFSRSSVLSLSVPLVRVKLGPILIETSKGRGVGEG